MDQRQFHQSRRPRAIAVALPAKRDERSPLLVVVTEMVSLLALVEAALLVHNLVALY